MQASRFERQISESMIEDEEDDENHLERAIDELE